MYKLAITLFTVVAFLSCKEPDHKQHNRLIENCIQQVRYMIVRKDSVCFENYQVEHRMEADSTTILHYVNGRDSFCISVNKEKGAFRLKYGTDEWKTLVMSDERWYTFNEANINLLRLQADKDVADGSVSFFYCDAYGVVLYRSDTWRNGTRMVADQDGAHFLELTALLYRLETDVDFITNPVTIPITKFATPIISSLRKE
ncbi:hypothetical protein [Chitinophaga sp. Cy-1792]|uniref:hypothetical protein n=1 Tax=Chitinophaga sp. Cy-1792 TaxID=2608339 RepID=UPI001422E5F1|nr:hypothetical protein [Chitinophaga sp. Cy-1792]NIG53329.1 hypothetical protein [Chitinophaga sp. Cy-1792]